MTLVLDPQVHLREMATARQSRPIVASGKKKAGWAAGMAEVPNYIAVKAPVTEAGRGLVGKKGHVCVCATAGG